jgi:hypothetical protein
MVAKFKTKLDNMITFKEFFPIMEMLDTEFDKIEWKQEGLQINGYGNLGDIKARVTLDPISYNKIDGINLTFAIFDGQKYDEAFKDQGTLNSGKIIGAVTNAIKHQLSLHNWDFVMIVSKDNVEVRHKLYVRIASRFSRELSLSKMELDKDNDKIIILSKLSNEKLAKIKDEIESE